MAGKDIKVAFRNIPDDNLRSGSPLRCLLEMATGRRTVVSRGPINEADLLVESSLFSTRRRAVTLARAALARSLGNRQAHSRLRARLSDPSPSRDDGQAPAIWVTGENVRPPTCGWRATLSFDPDPLGGANIYFPIWWGLTGLLGHAPSHFTSADTSLKTLLERRSTDLGSRRHFACAFIGNPDPMRLHAVEALSAVGEVHVYGNSVGRPVLDKHEVARHYRFAICFENDLYPGYVTEKPFEAWASGCIPIWWGDDPMGYINSQALLNLARIGSMARLVQTVARLEADLEEATRLAERPILARPPDLEGAVSSLRRLLLAPAQKPQGPTDRLR